MATSKTVPSTANALTCLSDFFTVENTSKAVNMLADCLEKIDDIPNFETKEIEVTRAVYRVREAVKVSFVYSRGYVLKCHSLAELVCNKEVEIIRAIQNENVDVVKRFLKLVLYKSQSCQKDIDGHLEFINKTNEDIDEKKKKIEEVGAQATKDTVKAGAIAGVATAVAVEAVVGTTVCITGAAGGGAVGILKTVLLVGPACANPVVFGSVVGVVGITVSVIALIVAVEKGAEAFKNFMLKRYCNKALDAIIKMTEYLCEMKVQLNLVKAGLKSAIDNNLEDLHEEFETGETPDKDILEDAFKMAAKQSITLKEYCEPLKNAQTFEEFVQYCKGKKRPTKK